MGVRSTRNAVHHPAKPALMEPLFSDEIGLRPPVLRASPLPGAAPHCVTTRPASAEARS